MPSLTLLTYLLIIITVSPVPSSLEIMPCRAAGSLGLGGGGVHSYPLGFLFFYNVGLGRETPGKGYQESCHIKHNKMAFSEAIGSCDCFLKKSETLLNESKTFHHDLRGKIFQDFWIILAVTSRNFYLPRARARARTHTPCILKAEGPRNKVKGVCTGLRNL